MRARRCARSACGRSSLSTSSSVRPPRASPRPARGDRGRPPARAPARPGSRLWSGPRSGLRSGSGSTAATPPASAGCREDPRATDRASAGGSYHGPVTDHELHRAARPRRRPRDKIGGKARSLVRLAAAGLRVPPAIVVTTELFASLRAAARRCQRRWRRPARCGTIESAARALAEAPWPAGFAEALAAALPALDGRAERAVRRPLIGGDGGSARRARRRTVSFAARLPRGRGRAARCARCWRRRWRRAWCSPDPGATERFAADGLGFAALIHPFVAGDAAGAAALDSSHGAPASSRPTTARPRGARARIQDALADCRHARPGRDRMGGDRLPR